MKQIKEEKYLETITDEDFTTLEDFHHSFIEDLRTKEKRWLEIKWELTDKYLELRDEISDTNFNNDIIKGIEQRRLSEYLKECGKLEREILNLSVFLERITKDEDTINWLFESCDDEFENIKDNLHLLILDIFRDTELYKEFIDITFQSIVLKDTDNFYNSFLHLLNLYTKLAFNTKSNYARLLTELLFDVNIPKKRKADSKTSILILTSKATKYGLKIQYKRKNKK